MILDQNKTYNQEELDELGIILHPKGYYGRPAYLSKDGTEGYLLEEKNGKFEVIVRWTYCRRATIKL